jgi:hypothetical protein
MLTRRKLKVLAHIRLRTASKRLRLFIVAVPLLIVSWALMWTQQSFWNPLFFLGLWVGAALLMYSVGENGYPGWRRHALLVSISIPLWWWFELVNSRVQNWEYVGAEDYSRTEYAVLATLAFSTVVPALHSAWGITIGRLDPQATRVAAGRRAWYAAESLAGVAMVAMVFAVPDLFFPLVWVGPFLLLDGLVGMDGGRSLAADVCRGDWRLAAAIGLAGLMCGFLWEFWNYWSTPKWIYHIPYLNYLRAFEMPVLGYAGYIPFAWSVYQLLHVRPIRRYIGGPF